MSDQVRTLLDQYAEALRTRDLDAVMRCFAEDAVVDAQGAPTAAGPSVRELYREILAVLTLDIAFTVETTVESLDGTIAAFTHSKGQQTDVSSGTSSPESNREAFVLAPARGGLTIRRYLFNVATG